MQSSQTAGSEQDELLNQAIKGKKSEKEIIAIITKFENLSFIQRTLEVGLMYAVKSNYIDLFTVLIKLVDVEYLRDPNMRIVNMIITHSNVQMMKVLISSGIDVNVKHEGENKLHIFSVLGKLERVKFCVECGFNINEQNDRGKTPLHLAIEEKHYQIVEFLTESGADLSIPDNNRDTPLHVAAIMRGLGVIKLLLQYGSDISSKNGYGMTPLHLASQGGNLEIIRLLIKYGSDVNSQNNEGKSILGIQYINNELSHAVKILAVVAVHLYHHSKNAKQEIQQIIADCPDETREYLLQEIKNHNTIFDMIKASLYSANIVLPLNVLMFDMVKSQGLMPSHAQQVMSYCEKGREKSLNSLEFKVLNLIEESLKPETNMVDANIAQPLQVQGLQLQPALV